MDDNLGHIDIHMVASARSVMTPATWRAEGLNRPYGRVFYIRSGSGFIRSCGRTHRLEAGHAYLIPPRGDLAYGCDGDLETWWMLFRASICGCVDLFDYLPFATVLEPEDLPALERDMLRLITLAAAGNGADQIAATGLLLTVIAPFFRAAADAQPPAVRSAQRRFLPVLRHIDEHLGHRLTLRGLARVAGLQESYFAALFAESFGLPPMKYVNRRRVERIQVRLQRDDAKLEALAQEFGFRDAFHLSKAFKRETGQSPSRYRVAARQTP